ncbi:glycosyltransferase [Nocardioides panacisoli]|uniref:Bifunctional glycosyltransferase family 2/GtrA family protein n=1 Tax=Nocardioides panacisoli TaxID=627624 RepID=A0ABP7IHM9_9ACTN
MTATGELLRVPGELAPATVDLDLVVPVHNEAHVLEHAVRHLDEHLATQQPYAYVVTIVDNASTDGTWEVAQAVAAELPRVRAVRLDRKGRGRALRAAWELSSARVVGYMDVDLSTDLNAVLPLVAPLLSGHSDISIGTRLSTGSRVVRGPKRELISRGYNLLLRGFLAARFTDAQCGFKALRRDVAERLVPLVEDDGWFFDTELLLLAEEAGLRIHEVPVDWVDDPDSRVDVWRTARDDLRGMARVAARLVRGDVDLSGLRRPAAAPSRPALATQLARFAAVGVLSTALYLLLYLLARGTLGAQAANLVALLVTAVGNTAANRRFTFGVTTRAGAIRDHVAGLGAFAAGLALTSGSLALLHGSSPQSSRFAEISVLVVANAAATLLRFVVLRRAVLR